MYFITICAHDRENTFSKISVGAAGRPASIILNNFGKIVDEELNKSAVIRKEIIIDQYVIMPNHLHCIVIIANDNPGGQPAAPTNKTLSSFVNGFKSSVTTRINTLRNTPGQSVWQRSYHDHIIRNEESLNKIRTYIRNNPLTWEEDEDNLSQQSG